MRKLYQQWIEQWETRLTTRDDHTRVVRPLEWGVEWTENWPLLDGHRPGHGAAAEEEFIARLNQEIVAKSDEFFSYRTASDFHVEDGVLHFTSPVRSPYPTNNEVKARWFPARGRRAVVLLPHWNSKPESYVALCKVFNLLGVSTLRLSLPYHDARMPDELHRADYAVSANIGRTIESSRQAVVDVRSCLDWLQQQGYTRLGVVGTSLGSCYAFIVAAHDPRISVCAFNHASTYFADVVWTGQSTRHIRKAIEEAIDLDRLRRAWLGISPMMYWEKFERYPKRSLIIYARYDLTFLPEFSQQVAAEFRRRNLEHKLVVLPCGHYTTGETPYKFLDGYHIARFLVESF